MPSGGTETELKCGSLNAAGAPSLPPPKPVVCHDDIPADWPFMPPYNPLEYEPLPPAPRPLRRRVQDELRRIALEAALRTALLAVGLLILHWLLAARGMRLDMNG